MTKEKLDLNEYGTVFLVALSNGFLPGMGLLLNKNWIKLIVFEMILFSFLTLLGIVILLSYPFFLWIIFGIAVFGSIAWVWIDSARTRIKIIKEEKKGVFGFNALVIVYGIWLALIIWNMNFVPMFSNNNSDLIDSIKQPEYLELVQFESPFIDPLHLTKQQQEDPFIRMKIRDSTLHPIEIKGIDPIDINELNKVVQ